MRRLSIVVLGLGALFLPAAELFDDRDSTIARQEAELVTLTDDLAELLEIVGALRAELAETRLTLFEASDELTELRQFIEDNNELGEDFEQYRGVRETAEREARARQAEEARERYEQMQAERRQRRDEARATREAEQADERIVDSYRTLGFSALGMNVYASRMSFFYRDVESLSAELEYEPVFGHFIQIHGRRRVVDFSSMKLSGSVMNTAAAARNIGVAITFFDESGAQVGHEIVQIRNARPDIPYPFTSTIDMALNRAFASSSTYVLYSDPVE